MCIFWNLVFTLINGFILILSVATHSWGNCSRHAKCCICRTGSWHWAWPTSSRLFLSLHAQIEKRLLLVGIDRLSSKPKLSKGESGLSQTSSSFWKMKEIASHEDIHPTSWKERWGSSWGVAHRGSSRFTQAGPGHPCQRLCPPASPGCAAAGRRQLLYQGLGDRQTDRQTATSFLRAGKWDTARCQEEHTIRNVRFSVIGSTRMGGGYNICAQLANPDKQAWCSISQNSEDTASNII